VQFKRKELIMPSGISSYYGILPTGISPYHQPKSRPPQRPSLMLRARVWFKDFELDAALAGGADPRQSEELALRAQQLAARKKREGLAGAINRLIGIADRHSRATMMTPYAPFRPWQIQANRSLLLELAQRLRGNKPVAVRGVALTSVMLSDGQGPLTTDSDPATVERAVRAALSGLEPDPRRREDARVRIGRREPARERIGTSA
jgi:hypothetical protein